MELITNKDFQAIIRKEEILTPNQIFRGLKLQNEDFITFEEFCKISRQETIKKYQAIRKLINMCFSLNSSFINGLWYTEENHPVLSILLQSISKDYLHVEETLYKYSNSSYSTTLENKGYKDIYYYFPITEENLDMILKEETCASKIDRYINENALEILTLYKKYLDEGIFYRDLNLTDITGKVDIQTHHYDFICDVELNSLTLPKDFGLVTASYKSDSLFNGIRLRYNPEEDETKDSSSLTSRDDLPKRLYIDRHFLPQAYQQKKES